MANEFEAYGGQGATAYVLLKGAGANRGLFWNGSTFVTYGSADLGTYALSMAELGTLSGKFQGNFPTAITASGTFPWVAYQQSGGSPAEGDTVIGTGQTDWTGVGAAIASTGGVSGSDWLAYVKRTFKRTDKDTEIFDATTDAIQVMRRRFMFDDAQVDTNTTATITVKGQYKIAVESDLGLLLDVTLQDSNIAFGLVQITKAEYDYFYPDASLGIFPGYPRHFAVWGGNIYIGPIPDKTTYTYRLNYSKRAGTVTSSTVSVPLTDLYRDILKSCALWQLNKTLEKFDSATFYRDEFENAFTEAVSRERKNRGEGTFLTRTFLS